MICRDFAQFLTIATAQQNVSALAAEALQILPWSHMMA
jgi:hypothetical protein